MSGRRNTSQFESYQRGAAKLPPLSIDQICSGDDGILKNIFQDRPVLRSEVSHFIRSIQKSKDLSVSTIDNYVQQFGYVEDFLNGLNKTFGLNVTRTSEIDQNIVNGYYEWTDGNEEYSSNVSVKDNTKNSRMGTLRRYHEWMERRHPDRTVKVSFEGLKWSGAHHGTKHHKPLSTLDVGRLVAACRVEIDETKAILRDSWTSIDSMPSLDLEDARASSRRAFSNPIRRMQALDHIYKNCRLWGDEFRAFAPGLASAMKHPQTSMKDLAAQMYLTTRTILPFILMISLPTAFNPSALLDLKWGQVSKSHPLYGEARWRLIGLKLKPYPIPQNRSFAVDPDDPYCVVSLLQFLEWAGGKILGPGIDWNEQHVFIAFQGLECGPSSFLDSRRDVIGALCLALKQFIKKWDLPHFTFVTTRTTGAISFQT